MIKPSLLTVIEEENKLEVEKLIEEALSTLEILRTFPCYKALRAAFFRNAFGDSHHKPS